MTSTGITLFDTVIGPCGIAWRADKIIGMEIGDADESETRYRLQSRFADLQISSATDDASDAPDYVSEAISKVHMLLTGGNPDFSQTPLALDQVPDLNRQVYEILLQLKAGETITYGAIARRLGNIGLSQAVGYALGKNPFPIIVPCHRVIGSNGKLGGFSAAGGTATKLRLLNIERARTSPEPDLFGGLPLQAPPRLD
ncbi:methylated-DNA--[protein]-cysteine S-methyltransferase [Brucella gallinifaecis]|uniref:methylated-DNA--[protein]-cysteine S-methyltransferase n=1 Tax=Brucella gallinifaecis TaxID=215590 RepID=A0A502BR17_9HYPH|nr:methylated-DNA--[protein]-cysteine S-methyltransferase [Brucella gallinifaecis]TPF75598.1 methylated-DNA--[protein]-cysteine S-methyltransferase [Brucella gallinifaecis]